MASDDENYMLSVPTVQLTEFTNTLFAYLYFQFKMTHQHAEIRMKRLNRYFSYNIGDTVLLIEKSACKYNNQVLDRFFNEVDIPTLCQKVCSTYPNSDYFKKLYYTTAFLMDLMAYWHRHTETADLSAGPSLWIEIFRRDFEREFLINGGWSGFNEAGLDLTDSTDSDGYISPLDILVPNFFWSLDYGQLQSMIPQYGRIEDINMKDIMEAIESVNDELDEVAHLEAENNPPEQFDENNPSDHFDENNPPDHFDENNPPDHFDENNPPGQFDENNPPGQFDENNPPEQFDENNPPDQYRENPEIPSDDDDDDFHLHRKRARLN